MIDFKNIEIKFGDFVAIPDLTMTINEGEFFTLLGPSGCGKTTTLRSLVGFIIPTKGKIFIEGEDITDVSVEEREIGMVFQSYALFPTMTVYENIAFGLRVRKEKKEDIDKKVKDIAEKVDLNEVQLRKKVSELSGGQQQRVAIARALILKPKILVLDEPLSNLDAKLRIQLRNELKELQKKFGITTIYVTHDQEEALTLSDRIAVFNRGIVEQIGTPFEIYNRSKTEFVCNFIGDINKIDRKLLKKFNEISGTSYNTDKDGYIRIERINTIVSDNSENYIKIKGKVIDKEFYGMFTKYMFETEGHKIKTLEKDDGKRDYEIGSVVDLYINKNDILQYEGD
ncbi:ABC transporter ATP-binding protein [Leptotrichia sp. OH3620_COT-345]|uniref:ABC transporter ATP-binding protein n=1 Tax=Leptotrichia sp. OH3620_COT-345 TaxID=2491048 RepID=UPI000F64FD88|nr:ABC transporter ATP-binding protein [Leptotrichia sp. OH3620_COT-345]RRD40223.1 ABC transporter ATP-binding protein [Leptotrichia sp. OH3620_COT-345]